MGTQCRSRSLEHFLIKNISHTVIRIIRYSLRTLHLPIICQTKQIIGNENKDKLFTEAKDLTNKERGEHIKITIRQTERYIENEANKFIYRNRKDRKIIRKSPL